MKSATGCTWNKLSLKFNEKVTLTKICLAAKKKKLTFLKIRVINVDNRGD